MSAPHASLYRCKYSPTSFQMTASHPSVKRLQAQDCYNSQIKKSEEADNRILSVLLVFNNSTIRGLSLVYRHYIYERHPIGPPCYNLYFSLHIPECEHRLTSISSVRNKHLSPWLQPVPVLVPGYNRSSPWKRKSFPLLSCLKLFKKSDVGSSENFIWLKFLERRIISPGMRPLWIMFPG